MLPAAPSLLYLGPREVARAAPSAAQLADAIASAFRAKGAGRARTAPKLSLASGQGNFSAKGAVWDEVDCAVVKWYGYIPHNTSVRGLPDFSPLVILSDASSGWPRAVLDGFWLSSARTAALSLAAARVLAKPDSSRIGFVACGELAHAHLHAFTTAFPLRSATCYSRSAANAGRLVDAANALGLRARIAADAAEAVQEHDIVVTSIPRQSEPRGYLDAGLLAPGAFAAMPCMGASWDMSTMLAIDLLATDDADPRTMFAIEPVAWTSAFHCDLAQLLQSPPDAATRRSAFMFSGSALADAAAASLIHRRAVALGIGQTLPFGRDLAAIPWSSS
ncbi:MAG: hypothetical protein K0Q43_4854 [Ramlibacter sp.]|nr:hypothetical protein [Ramlibacter sp.]